MRGWVERRWYSDRGAPTWLLPLSALYAYLTRARRQRLQARAVRLPVPVIVVGNISVGGTGKTPLAIWLVEHLREWGWQPGVISRGYGGRAPSYPWRVTARSRPSECGDEPLLIAQRTGVPVVVGPDRVAAARALIAGGSVDVIVSDDGLQHYRLARNLEICVIDGARGLGNGHVLPAGPLREAPSRLNEVPLVVVNGRVDFPLAHEGRIDLQLRATDAEPLQNGAPLRLDRLRGQRVHALAGIGHPQRFFDMLRGRGIDVIAHPFPDHHAFVGQDIHFLDSLPVLMTEKDAIKCRAFAGPQHYAVPVRAVIEPADEARIASLVQQSCARPTP